MPTVSEMVCTEQLGQLEEIAKQRGWDFENVPGLAFRLSMVAKDGSRFFLHVAIDEYPLKPPAWHWQDEARSRQDDARDTPKGGTFFHGAGVICAPWNRLAYQGVDRRGPHSDWTLTAWMSNANTGLCTTLAAMALRVFVELQAESFSGRMAS